MRAARIIGLIGWISSVGAGCASAPAYRPEIYVVQPRDTLYSIAWRHDLDYRDLALWNHVGPDYRIAVGQVLTLQPRPGDHPTSHPRAARAAPGAATAASGTAAGSTAAPGKAAPGTAGPSAPGPSAAAAGPEAPSTAESAGPGVSRPGLPCAGADGTSSHPSAEHWTWPTAHASAPRPGPGGGILVLGELGQPIRAACGGRVVYAGGGIRGYGNLIIIKHADTVLSAYAHTIELTVHEGQQVDAGAQIARMGSGPHRIAALYFEIRQSGKPVDPLPFLPRDN